ncbi:GGDEF domain-containing protein [Neptunomonas sp. XY-337]|uniref:GGDEF domain-containing protein n=1 Tax=Neptunomonas sp. XY-337 TaxID=2561897 RepID=UPI0010AB43CA|nr:GGDEF domain-containing protein [Neptunomonas sp. XY-337]
MAPSSLRHIFALLILFFGVTLSSVATAVETPRHILVLLAYRIDLPWSQAFISGLREAHKASGEEIEFYFEYIDDQRLSSRFTPAQLHRYLLDKYRDIPLSAIVMEPNTADRLLQAGTDKLFGDSMVVVVGTDYQRVAPDERFSYVIKRNLLQNNIALITQLHPDIDKLIVAGGAGYTATWLAENAARIGRDDFPNLKIEIAKPREPAALVDYLADQPEGTAILLTAYLRSPSGAAFDTPHVAHALLEKTSLPVYAIIDPVLGTGVIGGDLFNPKESARLALDKALAAMAAGKRDFSLVVLPNRYRFDQAALEQHDIKTAQLPLNSEVLNLQQPNDTNPQTLLIQAALASLLALALLGSLLLYRDRAKLTRELRSQHRMLELRVEQRTQALKVMAVTDSLTGLVNRGEFYRHLKLELRHFRDTQEENCFSIAMLDLDNFKRVNDRYGHPAGDKVLISFASRCNQLTRGPDIIGRLGGEEFAILLPNTNLQQATTILERVRTEVAQMRVELDSGDTVSVTTSIGVVVVDTPKLSTREVMMYVDQMLYTAKTQGKNRVWAGCTSTLTAQSPQQEELV